ncbi:bifunctional nicotinamide-nucleotide adenylyltransferase/Nudix hydroxylase [Diaphorobacter ruginosibacter]|uniref:Bifunctional nicotinamide-nucleotide adenylyltransferase/Nudix hydroxylase n=1 Tax=Diaphorobacter ruginosibacter TaxID=1715720 RepID=A0A7G9RQX7_9BURK|nr:bifunctional nicotinamide-nucleotide adenylyltransferase/Nudix hydroxylase [Diaphorobacter ruginosibacter]QNN58002.1 bifunctional nicotinamide-nucleotide adenylyltransferase/Nudix hydroxylase [Diaphorobacter ruginosibacter]
MYDTAILIGRFEPVHTGHLALLTHALQAARQVIVIVGSAFQARSPKNPFSWEERADMLLGSLEEHERARVDVVPVRDYYDEARWVHAVRKAVEGHTSPGTRIGLVGHFKDASSSYLSAFPGWELISLPRQGEIDATMIRNAYFGATGQTAPIALAPFHDVLPPSTRGLLERFAGQPEFKELQNEWRMLRGYREAWASAPYAPVFVTVDALLRCNDQILLIRRAHAPGRGLLALPGGFIEQRESIWQSCLRELVEETHCDVPAESLRQALREVHVFDHPDRSQRGRTITHAHYFDLGRRAALPEVRADDDAAQVVWVPIQEIASHEAAFFEDHFQILNHFLKEQIQTDL